jgi:hypothetical protein
VLLADYNFQASKRAKPSYGTIEVIRAPLWARSVGLVSWIVLKLGFDNNPFPFLRRCLYTWRG